MHIERNWPRGNPPILGLVAPLGCGKTTQADALTELSGAERMSCARPIRDMLAVLGVDHETSMRRKNEPISWLYDRTPRSLLKSLGTEWGRTYVGPDIWINVVLKRARSDGSRRVVIDDIRFDNEARAVKEAGGHLLYIHFPGRTYSWEHPSECGLSDWSLVDGVVGLSTGKVYFQPDCLELLPKRPWWANYALGRKLLARFARKSDFSLKAPLVPPHQVAREMMDAWDKLLGARP